MRKEKQNPDQTGRSSKKKADLGKRKSKIQKGIITFNSGGRIGVGGGGGGGGGHRQRAGLSRRPTDPRAWGQSPGEKSRGFDCQSIPVWGLEGG